MVFSVVRHLSKYVLGGLLLLGPLNIAAQPQGDRTESAQEGELEREVARLRDQLTEVRRDQLNYQIERDLLKETYSSHLQTLNLVLALILGAFAVLGYVGLKNLGGLKSEFQAELDKFRTSRSELEQQFRGLVQAQIQASTQVEQLQKENEEQDRRLKALEVREKVTALMSQANFALALDYVNVGLQLTPGDSVMSRQRFQCLTKLGRVSEAISAGESVLKLNPEDRSPTFDLAELYLVAARIEDYERLIAAHRDVVVGRSPLLLWYFESIRLLTVNDVPNLKLHLQQLKATASPEKALKIANWGFQEGKALVAGRTDLAGKELFLLGVEFLAGEIDGATFERKLAKLERRESASPQLNTGKEPELNVE